MLGVQEAGLLKGVTVTHLERVDKTVSITTAKQRLTPRVPL